MTLIKIRMYVGSWVFHVMSTVKNFLCIFAVSRLQFIHVH